MAVALAGAAHCRQAADDGGLKPDQALALRVEVSLVATESSGSVVAIASKAAGVMAMRVMVEVRKRSFPPPDDPASLALDCSVHRIDPLG